MVQSLTTFATPFAVDDVHYGVVVVGYLLFRFQCHTQFVKDMIPVESKHLHIHIHFSSD